MTEMLRIPEVMARTGLRARSTIWRKVRDGSFPAPVQIGANSIGWPADEISDWLAAQPRRTYGGDDAASTAAK